MTVNTTNIISGPYIGNNLNDTYSYDFRVDDKTQLSVYETTDIGIQTLLTVDTDYTVNNVGVDGGGTIVRLAGNLPTDYQWFIRSNRAENQLTNFSSQGAFFPDIHEAQMDHLTFLIQQLSDKVNRQFGYSDSTDVTGVDLTLPAPVADSIAAVWDSAGTALEIGPTTTEVSNAQGYAVAASASADAAAATYTTFDDRYLGSKSTSPATLNDGTTPLDSSHDGIEYWNSTSKDRWTWNGGTLSWGLTSSSVATSANLVSVSDAAGYYASTNVEGVLQEVQVGAQFYAHASTPLAMKVDINAGVIQDGLTVTNVALQTTTTFVAPTTNPRIDRVVIDNVTGVYSVITGTENASPVAPALTANKIAIAQILLQTTSSVIVDPMITDERAINQPIKTLESPVINTAVSGSAILDEDDMVSDSNTQLATQQSIKAYVDNNLVILDGAPSLASQISISGNTWTQVDMSVVYSAAFSAGAKKAIIRVIFGMGSSTASRPKGYVRKRGSGLSTGYGTLACAGYAPSGGVQIHGETTINLDANSDFDFYFDTSGVASALNFINIHLVGYYV